jgi:hypothetical protein
MVKCTIGLNGLARLGGAEPREIAARPTEWPRLAAGLTIPRDRSGPWLALGLTIPRDRSTPPYGCGTATIGGSDSPASRRGVVSTENSRIARNDQ